MIFNWGFRNAWHLLCNRCQHKIGVTILGILFSSGVSGGAAFTQASSINIARLEFSPAELCATAKQTLTYLNQGTPFDPQVIHGGKVLPFSLSRIKATLRFICQHQAELKNPDFVQQHFDFIHWQPDIEHAKSLAANKPLLKHLPSNRILMTKYYVHLAKGSFQPTVSKPYALYALPEDEQGLSIEIANTKANLTRFRYGKQAILAGALNNKNITKLAYLSREDLESALLQGTVVVDFGVGKGQKIFNVDRNNNVNYDRLKSPYEQERYWYFKEVDGIKGYGKDADHKITVNIKSTFAADLSQLGLGKLLMVQYPDHSGKMISRIGVLADTGGAFSNNLYQVDFLTGSYPNKETCYRETRNLPDYVNAYFMVLKKQYT